MGPMTQHSTMPLSKLLISLLAHSSSPLGGLLNIDIEGSSEFTKNQENYYEILRYIKNVLPYDDFDVILHAADVFGKLFVYGDPTIVESVIEIEIQRSTLCPVRPRRALRRNGLVVLSASMRLPAVWQICSLAMWIMC